MTKRQKHFWYEKKIICTDTKENVIGYEAYLKTKHWKNKRDEILKRDQYQCQRCGSPNDLVVHHKTYNKTLGHEKNCHLITYCNKCHRTIHNQQKDTKDITKKINKLVSGLTKNEKENLYKKLIQSGYYEQA